MAQVVLAEELQADVDRIFDFLFEHAPETAAERIAAVIAALDVLQLSLLIGRPVENGKREKRAYTSAFESARTLGRLLAPQGFTWKTELPLRAKHVPLIIHLSCNAHLTTFIPCIAQEVLKRLHAWRFDLKQNGREIHDYRPLKTYELRVDAGDVYVRVDEAARAMALPERACGAARAADNA